MQAVTMIHIRKDLKGQLDELNRHPKDSYNYVIERLVSFDTPSSRHLRHPVRPFLNPGTDPVVTVG